MARTMRWAMVGSGTRNARAISAVVRPPSKRRVSATRASVESTGWQAVNTRRQEIVADLVVERRVEIGAGQALLRLELVTELLVLALEQLVPAEMVDRAMLRRGHEPGARVARDALLRPLFERRDQRVLCEVLGDTDVAHDPRQPGDEPRRFDPPDRVDGEMCNPRSGTSRRQPSRLPITPSSIRQRNSRGERSFSPRLQCRVHASDTCRISTSPSPSIG